MNKYNTYSNQFIWHQFAQDEGGRHPFLFLQISETVENKWIIKGLQGTSRDNKYYPIKKYYVDSTKIAELPKRTWFKKEIRTIMFNNETELIDFLNETVMKKAFKDIKTYCEIKNNIMPNIEVDNSYKVDLEDWIEKFNNY